MELLQSKAASFNIDVPLFCGLLPISFGRGLVCCFGLLFLYAAMDCFQFLLVELSVSVQSVSWSSFSWWGCCSGMLTYLICSGPSLANLHGGAEPPKFPKITPSRKGPPLPPYKNFPDGGAMAPLAPPPSATGLDLLREVACDSRLSELVSGVRG